MLTLIKLGGLLTIVVCCSAFGFSVAAGLRRRPRDLGDIAAGLEALASEVSYGATPLPEALARVGASAGDGARPLFAVASENMAGRHRLTAKEAWTLGVTALYPRRSLTREDTDALLSLSPVLGLTDTSNQIRHLQSTIAAVKNLARKAEEEQASRARMWQYMGVLSGLLVALLFY
jgi:stage III sporulation protein AB